MGSARLGAIYIQLAMSQSPWYVTGRRREARRVQGRSRVGGGTGLQASGVVDSSAPRRTGKSAQGLVGTPGTPPLGSERRGPRRGARPRSR